MFGTVRIRSQSANPRDTRAMPLAAASIAGPVDSSMGWMPPRPEPR